MVTGGVGAHGGLAHWAGIPCFHIISMSHESISFSVIVLVVFCSQFSVFCYPFTMVSLCNTTSYLFDLILHAFCETFSTTNNNFFLLLFKGEEQMP